MISNMCNIFCSLTSYRFPKPALLYAVSSLSQHFRGWGELLESRLLGRQLGVLLIIRLPFWAGFLYSKAACSFKWVPQPWDMGSLQPAAQGVSYDVSIPEFLMKSPEQKICYFTSPKSHFELINEQRHRKTYGFGGTGKNEIISALRNHYAPIIVFVKKRRFHLPFITGSKSRFRAKKKKRKKSGFGSTLPLSTFIFAYLPKRENPAMALRGQLF